jgi:hypothetical protein
LRERQPKDLTHPAGDLNIAGLLLGRRDALDALDLRAEMMQRAGSPGAASVLRASFRNAERNYARLEHLALVIDDPEVQAFLRPPVKSPAEELRELRESMARRAPDALEAFDRSRGGRR